MVNKFVWLYWVELDTSSLAPEIQLLCFEIGTLMYCKSSLAYTQFSLFHVQANNPAS